MLNARMSSGERPDSSVVSSLTRSKICATLMGRTYSAETRAKKSMSRMGALNPFYEVAPGIKVLDAAAEKAGTKVYVYSADDFALVNGMPFRSLRGVSTALPVTNDASI